MSDFAAARIDLLQYQHAENKILAVESTYEALMHSKMNAVTASKKKIVEWDHKIAIANGEVATPPTCNDLSNDTDDDDSDCRNWAEEATYNKLMKGVDIDDYLASEKQDDDAFHTADAVASHSDIQALIDNMNAEFAVNGDVARFA